MLARSGRERFAGGWRLSGHVRHPGAANAPLGQGRGRALSLGVLAVAVAIVAVAAGTALARHHSIGGLLSAAGSAGVPAPPARPLTPTRVVGLPARTLTNGTEPLGVTLSAPPARDSPRPTLRPAVAGTWRTVGDAELFTPVSTLEPCSAYTLTVWADTIATGHSRVGRRRVIALRVACPPLAGLQQALARLGYLGAVLHPIYEVRIRSGVETRREAAVHAYRPPRGRLAPHPADAPPVEVGQLDATTRGALTVYQSDHGLEATGEPNRATWVSVLAAETLNHRTPQPYTWVTVTESLPETLEVHRGDRVALSTPVNTGVAGAETAQGIFPIFSRLVSTTMTGTDPDGTHYVAPDVPWVNYFNGGDAVHGYPRASYGFPQSNGCVELPIEAAHTAFGMLAIGDIVWVT